MLDPSFVLPKGMFRVSRTPVWSTVRLQAGCCASEGQRYEMRLFSAARGQLGQGHDRPLGEADTNLVEGSRLPGSYDACMIVDAVEWRVFGGTESERLAVVEGGSWGWEFAHARRFDGSPLTTFDAGDFDTLPEDERVGIVEALRVRDESVNGRLSYTGKPNALPMNIPAGCVFNLCLSLSGFSLTRDVFVRFVLRGESQSAVPIS